MRGSELFLRALKKNGVKNVYGIVGREAEAILFNEVKGINFMLTRDERSAAYMADMEGRMSPAPGVCYSTFGPGASNLATGIASAYMDRSAMLAVSAQVERRSIHPSTHQCLDQVSMMRPITKYAKEISRISELEPEVNKAIRISKSGIPGPCFLSIPLDIFRDEFNSARGRSCAGALPYEDERAASAGPGLVPLKKISAEFAAASHPVVIVGPGVAREGVAGPLEKFLNNIKAPAVTTYAAKGSVNPDKPYYLGTVSKYLDYLSPGALEGIFCDSDLVLLLGIDMVEGISSELWEYGRSKKVLSLNSLISRNPQLSKIDGAANAGYREFFEYFTALRPQGFFCREELLRMKEDVFKLRHSFLDKPSGSLSPFSIVGVLNEVLSPGDILISDVGLHKQYLSLYYEVKSPGGFYCSNGLGAMGFGFPAALGAKNVSRKSRVVAVCGDAGFHSSSQELETSVRYKLPVICIVFHDRSTGLIRHYQDKGFGRRNPATTDFGDVDFVELARANGCKGYRIRSIKELRRVLSGQMDTDITVLLEVMLDKNKYK